MRATLFSLLLLTLPGCGDDVVEPQADMAVGGPDIAMPEVDMAGVATGTKLADGKLVLVGVTTDDFAVYRNEQWDVKAVKVTGGASQAVSAEVDAVMVDGKLVYTWKKVDWSAYSRNLGVGEMTVWSSAGGAKVVAAASIPFYVATSDDGAAILYTDKAVNKTAQADLMYAKTDGSGAKVVMSAMYTDGDCFPLFAFAAARPVVAACPVAAMGHGKESVFTYDVAAGKAATLVADSLGFWSSDKAGGKVFAIAADGTASVFPAAGGAGTKIDTGVVEAGFLFADGNAVTYLTQARTLKHAKTTAPMPAVLVANDPRQIETVSADEKWLVFSSGVDKSTGYVDLYLTSTTTAGKPVTLHDKADGALGGVFGSAFTKDQSRVLYFTDINEYGVGDLKARAIDGSGSAAKIGTNTWMVLAASGTKVVLNDNYYNDGAPQPDTFESADIKVIDAKGGSPTLIADQAGLNFRLNAAGDKIVYTKSALYVAPIP